MNRRVKKETLKHYRDMIEWANKQPQKERPSDGVMKMAIGETWSDGDCPLCNNYHRDGRCTTCPLFMAGHGCNEWYSIWQKMRFAKNWELWVNEASRLMAVIRSL